MLTKIFLGRQLPSFHPAVAGVQAPTAFTQNTVAAVSLSTWLQSSLFLFSLPYGACLENVLFLRNLIISHVCLELFRISSCLQDKVWTLRGLGSSPCVCSTCGRWCPVEFCAPALCIYADPESNGLFPLSLPACSLYWEHSASFLFCIWRTLTYSSDFSLAEVTWFQLFWKVLSDPSSCDRYLTKVSCGDRETVFLLVQWFFSLIFSAFLSIQHISCK